VRSEPGDRPSFENLDDVHAPPPQQASWLDGREADTSSDAPRCMRTPIAKMHIAKPLRLGSHRTSRTVGGKHEVEAAMEALANRSRRLEWGLEARCATGGPHALGEWHVAQWALTNQMARPAPTVSWSRLRSRPRCGREACAATL
jgi:hypothetical protein